MPPVPVGSTGPSGARTAPITKLASLRSFQNWPPFEGEGLAGATARDGGCEQEQPERTDSIHDGPHEDLRDAAPPARGRPPAETNVSADFEALFCLICWGRTICLEEYSLTRAASVG